MRTSAAAQVVSQTGLKSIGKEETKHGTLWYHQNQTKQKSLHIKHSHHPGNTITFTAAQDREQLGLNNKVSKHIHFKEEVLGLKLDLICASNNAIP